MKNTTLNTSIDGHEDHAIASRWFKAALCGGCSFAALMLFADIAAPSAHAAELEEITVTVQRRTERLVDVPASVVALSAESMDRGNVTSLLDVGNISPGVIIGHNGAYVSPTIRGVTTQLIGVGNENNVGVYIDGFYVSNTLSLDMDLANIDSVQILKGPQGALWGRNATGGAILITTRPSSDKWTARVEGNYGRFNEWGVNGYVSGPITERMRFSVAGSHKEGDGWSKFQDPTNASKTFGHFGKSKHEAIRAKIDTDITDDLTVTLGMNYGLTDDVQYYNFSPIEHQPTFVPPPPFRPSQYGVTAYNYAPKNNIRTHSATALIQYKTGIGTLTSRTAYDYNRFSVELDYDGMYADFGFAQAQTQQRTFQQSVDYTIDAVDNLNLIVGGAYFHDHYKQAPGGEVTYYAPGLVKVLVMRRPLKSEAYAFYADAQYKLNDRLTLGLGGRYNHDYRYVSQIQFDGTQTITYYPFNENRVSKSRFTPRANLRYEFDAGSNVYASYSKGFKAGIFNQSAAASPATDRATLPEDINAYEVGMKMARPGFRAEVAAYYYDYRNLNVSLTTVDPALGVVTTVGNAKEATIYGIDGQVTFMPVDDLNVTVGAAWTHARYGSFPNAVGTGLDPVSNGNISGQIQNWSGQQLTKAPNFTANFNVDYTVPLATGSLLLTGSVAYSDSFVVNDPSTFGPLAGARANQQRYRNGKTATVNASATWTDPSDHYWIGVYGRNLTNLKQFNAHAGSAFGDWGVPQQPISYGVKAGYKF